MVVKHSVFLRKLQADLFLSCFFSEASSSPHQPRKVDFIEKSLICLKNKSGFFHGPSGET